VCTPLQVSGTSELGHVTLKIPGQKSFELELVTITKILSPDAFWVQKPASKKHVDLITERLAAMSTDSVPQASAWPLVAITAKMGEMCVARFDADGTWYRAAVEARKVGSVCA